MDGMNQTRLDECIKDAAARNTPEAIEELSRQMQGREVFFRIVTETHLDPLTGRESESVVGSPLLKLSSGEKALLVHSSKEDPALERPFGGATWEHALRIADELPEAHGLLLRNAEGDTVAIDKAHVHTLRSFFNESRPAPPRSRQSLRPGN